MEYEFSHDTVNGGFHAKFSMEHEAFSSWLVEEVGSNAQQIDNLLLSVNKIRQHNTHELTFQGKEYLLTLNEDDVTLQLNASCDGFGSINSEQRTDELSINHDNFCAECGLDDFSKMLSSWKGFLDA